MKNTPFLLRPAAKDYLWGGSRLNDDFAKGIDCEPLAETWECSTHPDGQSIAAETGEPLGDILKRHPEFMGEHPLQIMRGRPELPIMIKLIDAKQCLSLQVHPDDEYAMCHEGCLGKTEMWYVLSAREQSELILGFSKRMNPELLESEIRNGLIARDLNHIRAEANQVYFVEAGTVHAIGAGVLLAEIQESSNLTYRLYDYDRFDRNGEKRALHLNKALSVIHYEPLAIPRQPMRVLRYRNGYASEFLSRCRYFQVERMLLNTEGRQIPMMNTGNNSFHALLCTEGCGVLFGEGFMLNFFKGDCIFVPANSVPIHFHGRAQFLNVSC